MKRILTIAGAVLLAACQSTENYADAEARLQAEIAAKQGEEVNRICFTRSINGWHELGRDAILLERGVDDWYKLDLLGTCRPEWAFNAIALKTRPSGSSCLSRGDEIETLDQPINGSCVITDIYEWDEDAEVANAPAY